MYRVALRIAAIVATTSLAFAPEVAHAQGASTAPTPADVKVATSAFQQGTKLFQAKKYALALTQFQKSYDTVSSPNSLLYIARCQAETGAYRDAYLTFGRVVVEADERGKTEAKYIPTRDSAKVERDEVGNKISLLTVTIQDAQESTRLKVGGSPVPREAWGQPIPLEPGSVEVLLETDGIEPATQRIDLVKGDKKNVELAVKLPEKPIVAPPPPPPPSEGPSGLFIGGLVAAGVGVIGMGMFGIAGGMSLGTYSEVEDNCGTQPSGRCSASGDLAVIDRGQREQLIANIGLIIGGVGLATGATLLVVDLATSDSGSAEAEGSAGAASKAGSGVSAKLDVGAGYVGVRGTF